MKQCTQCNETKDLTEFYKHPQAADGYLNQCKTCKKASQAKIRLNNHEYYKAYDRNRPNKEERNKQQKEYQATEKGKEVRAKATTNYRTNNPLKYKAHCLVNNAIKNGNLIRPANCEICGVECKPHGHHNDYTKPLEINWLCNKCHKQWHKEHGKF